MPLQVRASRLQHEVVMIGYEAIGKTEGIEAFEGLAQDFEQHLLVVIVFEDGIAPVTASARVLERTRRFCSQNDRGIENE